MTLPSQIFDRILEAALARRLAPGSRLGEKDLAALFSCSRTLVREALIRLEARGLVTVSARRGWYLGEPTRDQAREVFEARLIVETGLLRQARPPGEAVQKRLRAHLHMQKRALAEGDPGVCSFLLGDFHVCLADALGNSVLAETVRDLTVRTTLAAAHHQSDAEAAHSCAQHAGIVSALAEGDMAEAAQRMAQHLGNWEAKLHVPEQVDPLAQLRHALAPVNPSAYALHTSLAARKGRETMSQP